MDQGANHHEVRCQRQLWRERSVDGQCRGYANNPKATAEAITPDGWLRTGDVAVVDKDGFISITERLKELIKYKGFQGTCACSFSERLSLIRLMNAVAPAELEDILGSHPDVGDCAVIGVYKKEEATELPKHHTCKEEMISSCIAIYNVKFVIKAKKMVPLL